MNFTELPNGTIFYGVPYPDGMPRLLVKSTRTRYVKKKYNNGGSVKKEITIPVCVDIERGGVYDIKEKNLNDGYPIVRAVAESIICEYIKFQEGHFDPTESVERYFLSKDKLDIYKKHYGFKPVERFNPEHVLKDKYKFPNKVTGNI